MKVSLFLYLAAVAAVGAVCGVQAQTVQSKQADVKILQGMGKDISEKLTAIEQQLSREFAYIGNQCGAGDQMVDGSGGCRKPNGANLRLEDVPAPNFAAPPAAAQPVAAVPPPEGYNQDGTPITSSQNEGGGNGGGGEGGGNGGGDGGN